MPDPNALTPDEILAAFKAGELDVKDMSLLTPQEQQMAKHVYVQNIDSLMPSTDEGFLGTSPFVPATEKLVEGIGGVLGKVPAVGPAAKTAWNKFGGTAVSLAGAATGHPYIGMGVGRSAGKFKFKTPNGVPEPVSSTPSAPVSDLASKMSQGAKYTPPRNGDIAMKMGEANGRVPQAPPAEPVVPTKPGGPEYVGSRIDQYLQNTPGEIGQGEPSPINGKSVQLRPAQPSNLTRKSPTEVPREAAERQLEHGVQREHFGGGTKRVTLRKPEAQPSAPKDDLPSNLTRTRSLSDDLNRAEMEGASASKLRSLVYAAAGAQKSKISGIPEDMLLQLLRKR